jgi:hypothetical protein
MAGPLNKTFVEGQMLVLHNAELYNKAQRADFAYVLLTQYNWEGTGTMPANSWVDPLGNTWDFSIGLGAIHIGGTSYSGLNAEKKRIFFQYLPKFIQDCLDNYDDFYNL